MCKVDFISCPDFSFSKETVVRFLKKYAEDEGYTVAQIQYNFLDKPSMLELNNRHLNHNNHTDVITFDYSEKKAIKAEVYISIETMKENAKEFGQTADYEAVRLISHALFHCMGYSDKNDVGRKRMRAMEDRFINDVSRETISNV